MIVDEKSDRSEEKTRIVAGDSGVKGFRLNHTKTEYMVYDLGTTTYDEGDVVPRRILLIFGVNTT